MFGNRKNGKPNGAKDIGLLGTDTRFEGAIRFTGTLRIDGIVVGDILSEPGSGSVLVVNKRAVVNGNIVSDSVLVSGRVEGNINALERVEIFRAGFLKGDVRTADIMIEGGAEFEGYCHMQDRESALLSGSHKPAPDDGKQDDGKQTASASSSEVSAEQAATG
ncbi:MAG: polymer-forming cytoskeletal protein [bacterium]